MFEVILFSKVPMEVNIFNTKFIVSHSAQKLLKFDCKKSFSFEYNFVGKNSIVYSANFDFLNDNLTSKNKSIKILKFEENKFSIEILQKNSEFLQSVPDSSRQLSAEASAFRKFPPAVPAEEFALKHPAALPWPLPFLPRPDCAGSPAWPQGKTVPNPPLPPG